MKWQDICEVVCLAFVVTCTVLVYGFLITATMTAGIITIYFNNYHEMYVELGVLISVAPLIILGVYRFLRRRSDE